MFILKLYKIDLYLQILFYVIGNSDTFLCVWNGYRCIFIYYSIFTIFTIFLSLQKFSNFAGIFQSLLHIILFFNDSDMLLFFILKYIFQQKWLCLICDSNQGKIKF